MKKKTKELLIPKVEIQHIKKKWEATQIGTNILHFKKPPDMEWKEVFDSFLEINKNNSI